MVIQHNIPALNSHRYLGINNSKTAKNLEKLSSGYKINRAADDAAGLAISEKMRGQISGLGMAEQNANNGISLIQTAEGGLNETHSILQRMRELAVQSSNGTYQDEDRAQIELEYQALKSEMDRIASYTNYNGIKLLDGTVGGARLELTKAPGLAIEGKAADVAKDMGVVVGSAAGTFTVNAGTTVDVTVPGTDLTALTDYAGAPTADVSTVITTALLASDKAGSVELTFTNGAWVAGTPSSTGGTASVSGTILTVEGSANTKASDVDWSALGTNYEEGSKITIGVNGSGVLETSGYSGKTTSSTTAVQAASATSDLTGTWNGKGWDVSGYITLKATSGGVDGYKTVKVNGSFDITKDWEFTLEGGATYKIAAAGFATPDPAGAEKLVAGHSSFRISTDGASSSITAATGYRVDPNAKPLTADQVRINNMLTSMGISDSSDFNLSQDYFQATGLTPDDAAARALLFGELNGKDAYIITRASLNNVDERNVYDATQGYETLLQVGDRTFLGVDDGNGNINFEMTDPMNPEGANVVIASLSRAGVASESGSIRFNIGNVLAPGVSKLTNELSTPGNQYYAQKLIHKENAIVGSENTAQLVFQVGANGAEDQRIGMYVFNMSSNNLGDHVKGQFISESSILTRDLANDAVNTIDKAVMYVSSQRAELGALQNRLEHTLNNLGVTKENLTAAESSIRDVDMAKEMMDFTKNNILVQAAQAMLAQANQLPQGVLQLLR